MGLDVDYVFGRDKLNQIDGLFRNLPHGERGWMVDRINEFYNSLEREILIKEAENQGTKRSIVEPPEKMVSHV